MQMVEKIHGLLCAIINISADSPTEPRLAVLENIANLCKQVLVISAE